MKDKLTEQIIAIIAEQLNMDSAEISADTNLKDDLNADSIDLAELAMTLEDAFQIPTPEDGDLPELTTVHDVISYVERCAA